MASTPIRNYVKKQILAQGGYSVLVARMRAGETLPDMARTFFRPDGIAINRRTLGWLMHKEPGIRLAMHAAVTEWRSQSEWTRRQQRKAIHAEQSARIIRARLALDGPETFQQRTYLAHVASLTTTGRSEYGPLARPPLPRAVMPAPVVAPPEPEPLPPPKRQDVEWDEVRPWCHACESGECQHVKREYTRRAQAYADDKERNQPRIIRGLV